MATSSAPPLMVIPGGGAGTGAAMVLRIAREAVSITKRRPTVPAGDLMSVSVSVPQAAYKRLPSGVTAKPVGGASRGTEPVGRPVVDEITCTALPTPTYNVFP